MDLTGADARKIVPEEAVKRAKTVTTQGFGLLVFAARFVRNNAKDCSTKLQHFANRCD